MPTKAEPEIVKNYLVEEELNKNSVVANFATTSLDGKIYQVDYYNLDVIISVGYRVKSKEGTQFRIWANSILKNYMLKGYAVNQRRLEYLEKTIKLIDIANRIDERPENNDAKEIFLIFYGILYKDNRQVIDNNTLTALTLLIAESNPKEKDIIIDLVTNFLND